MLSVMYTHRGASLRNVLLCCYCAWEPAPEETLFCSPCILRLLLNWESHLTGYIKKQRETKWLILSWISQHPKLSNTHVYSRNNIWLFWLIAFHVSLQSRHGASSACSLPASKAELTSFSLSSRWARPAADGQAQRADRHAHNNASLFHSFPLFDGQLSSCCRGVCLCVSVSHRLWYRFKFGFLPWQTGDKGDMNFMAHCFVQINELRLLCNASLKHKQTKSNKYWAATVSLRWHHHIHTSHLSVSHQYFAPSAPHQSHIGDWLVN